MNLIGKKYRALRSFPSINVTVGEMGYVFNQYQDFDYPDKQGVQVIFENGGYDGFGFAEQGAYLEQIPSLEDEFSHQGYVFNNVMQVAKDYQNGWWSF